MDKLRRFKRYGLRERLAVTIVIRQARDVFFEQKFHGITGLPYNEEKQQKGENDCYV